MDTEEHPSELQSFPNWRHLRNCPSDIQAWLDIHARLNQALGLLQHFERVGHGASTTDLNEVGEMLLEINSIVTNVIGQ